MGYRRRPAYGPRSGSQPANEARCRKGNNEVFLSLDDLLNLVVSMGLIKLLTWFLPIRWLPYQVCHKRGRLRQRAIC